jgi:hypothetical protein
MNINEIIRKHLQSIKEEQESPNYMFYSNLEQMKRQCELLLELDPHTVDEILMNGHDWADDHITSAKENIDQVFDFMMNETKRDNPHEDEMMNEESQINEAKHKPTNAKLWARAKSMAKSKFKVYPSAYANGWAAKWYKSKGGGWKTVKK